MWIAVLLVLFITGVIFYGLATYYMTLQQYKKDLRAATRPRKVAFADDKQKDDEDDTGLLFINKFSY